MKKRALSSKYHCSMALHQHDSAVQTCSQVQSAQKRITGKEAEDLLKQEVTRSGSTTQIAPGPDENKLIKVSIDIEKTMHCNGTGLNSSKIQSPNNQSSLSHFQGRRLMRAMEGSENKLQINTIMNSEEPAARKQTSYKYDLDSQNLVNDDEDDAIDEDPAIFGTCNCPKNPCNCLLSIAKAEVKLMN